MIIYNEDGSEQEPASLTEWRRLAYANVDPERVKPLLDAFNELMKRAVRIVPSTVAIENLGVQPLSYPQGLIFSIRHTWEFQKGETDEKPV